MTRRALFSLLFAAVAVLMMTGALPAEAASPVQIKAALQAGGDRLVQEQNADGGWFWYADDPDCGAGAGVSCPNISGVTALGLIDSYAKTRDIDHKNAAKAAGDALVARREAAPPCDGISATGGDRPYSVDTDFLVQLTKLTGDRRYKANAASWFSCIVEDFPSGADRADERIDRRIGQNLNNLGEWDAALDIRAALALGQRAYALAEALRVIERQPDWDVYDADCEGCELLGKGLLLAAVHDLRSNKTIQAAMASWQADLLTAQEPDGSWGEGSTQTTAYVVMGLARYGAAGGRAAVVRGRDFLLSMQLASGGFMDGVGFPDENNEVTSEVLQALNAP